MNGRMKLRQPGPEGISQATAALREVRNQLQTTRGVHGADQLKDRWLAWWENYADAQLRSIFTDTDLAAGLYVAQAEVRRLDLQARPHGLIGRLTDEWIARFDEVIGQLNALLPFVMRPGQIVMPDTSAFMEGPYFDTFNWHSLDGLYQGSPVRLVVPILVVEEMDDLKYERRRQDRARSVLRRLWELNGGKPTEPAVLPHAKPGPVTVEIWLDDPWHVRRPVNDEEIVDRAKELASMTGRQVVLAAGDYSQLYRGSAAGVRPALMLKSAPPTPVQAVDS
jgi:hypothetical protein